MKKTLALSICFLLLFSMSACGNKDAGTEDSTQKESSLSVTKKDEENAKNEDGNSLIVYFSLFGNTEYPDGIDASTSASIVIDNDSFGTTEYVARMIQESTGGDIHFIQTQEPYPADFDELRDQNHNEMDESYLPPLVESNLDMAKYDTVFIGYPVWATDVPQAVLSFLSEYDLSGKTVIPFCTHDGYGAGRSYDTIYEASHAAELLDGLALEAKDVPSARDMVSEWLETIEIVGQNDREANRETAITITIGDTVLDGVIYDTALAQEIREQFPLTISMVGYGGREYYGGVDFLSLIHI